MMRRHAAILLAGAALMIFAGVVQAQYQDQPYQPRQQQNQPRQQLDEQNQQQQQQSRQQPQDQMPSGSGTQLYLGQATVMQIQQKLQQEGHNVGSIDGQWGQSTSQALKSFQQQRQLPASGKIDISTLTALGINSCQVAMGGQTGQPMQQQNQQRNQQDWQQQNRPQDQQRSSQNWQQQNQQNQQNQRSQQNQPMGTQQGYHSGQPMPSQSQMSQMSQTGSGSHVPLYAGPDVAQQIHQKLKSMGHEVGERPRWGGQMKQAVKRFQQDSNLEPTGNLNFETLAALGIQPTSAQGGQQQSQWQQQNQQQRSQQNWDQQNQPNQPNQPKQQDQQKTQQTWGQQTRTTQVSENELIPIYLSPSAVMQVQRSLEQQGQNLSVDGKFGPQTSKVVKQFQQQQGLGASGQIDFETLCALDLAQGLDDLAMIGDRERDTLTRRNRPGQQENMRR